MTKDFHEITRSVSKSLRPLRSDIPGVTHHFTASLQTATVHGALDHKTEECGRGHDRVGAVQREPRCARVGQCANTKPRRERAATLIQRR